MDYQKKKSANTLPMQNLGRTPVVRAGQTSTNSISDSAENVKEKLSGRDTVGVRKSQIKADAYAHDTAGRQPIADILTKIKKETDKWFQALGQPVPTGGTKYGFINSISDSAAKVKEKSSDRDTAAATGSIPIKGCSRLHDRW